MVDVVLVVATVTAGLMAGLFFGFSWSVMLGLSEVDDPVFVDVMRRINRRIQNPVFLLLFLGSLLANAAVLFVGSGLARLGAGIFLLSLLITFAVNIPLNVRLDGGGTRDGFERRWVRWNHVRTLTSVAGFVVLALP